MVTFFATLVLMLAACGDSVGDVQEVDGEYFHGTPEKRIPFHLEGEDAKQLARLVSNLKPTEHLKWQGSAVFTITHADGSTMHVQVCDADAVLIGDKAYTADTKAMLALIKKGIDQASD